LVIGEAARQLLGHWWGAFRQLYFEERLVIDVFLGAGVVYAILWIPFGIFGTGLLLGVLGGAIIVLFLNLFKDGLSHAVLRLQATLHRTFNSLHWLSLIGVAILSLCVLALEATVALSQPAGNTLDGANATLSTALLVFHGHFVTSISPYASFPLYQPQGITTWFASAHVLVGLPLWASANETSPIFVALIVPAAAAVGRRWLGGEVTPVVFAAAFALFFSWPRMMVQGTYDFVGAAPLALVLLPWAAYLFMGKNPGAKGSPLPVVALLSVLCMSYSPLPLEAIATGLVVGSVLLMVLRPRQLSHGLRRLCRCLAVPVIALIGVIPSLWLIATHHDALSGGSAAGHGTVLVAGDLPTMLDPFLFNTSWVSPFTSLHYEFLVLLLAGVGLLLFGSRMLKDDEMGMSLAILLPSLTGAGLLLVVMALSGTNNVLFSLTNASELAIFFVMVESLLVALPVAYISRWILDGVKLEKVAGSVRKTSSPGGVWNDGSILGVLPRNTVTVSAALVLVLASFVYPVVVTTSDLTTHLDSELSEVSNVTQDDINAMEYLSTLSAGPVLVAPGSAGEFLPAFCSDPLMFPLVGIGGGMGFSAGFKNGNITIPFSGPSSNSTYLAVVGQLVNGSLTSQFPSELSILQVTYILVTGASTSLFPPFLPSPLLANSEQFELKYQSGDAYLFQYALASR
jgi:hypothetical protein